MTASDPTDDRQAENPYKAPELPESQATPESPPNRRAVFVATGYLISIGSFLGLLIIEPSTSTPLPALVMAVIAVCLLIGCSALLTAPLPAEPPAGRVSD
jgi:hypothetical protein